MKQRLSVLIVVLILFSVFIWTNSALAWTTRIHAEGENLIGVNQANVKIGVASEAKRYPSAPPVPKYSVKMDLYSSDLAELFSEDIRQEGDIQHRWIIGIDPHGNVEPADPDGRTATLSWDPSQFGPGTYQLQAGYDGTGAIVVADMKTTTSYDVTGTQSDYYQYLTFFTLIFTELDSDGDDVPDRLESCPNDPNKTEPGVCGCGAADIDSDSDGALDCNDGCPYDPNKIAAGICGCGVADIDSDSDGALDCNDGCPYDPNKTDPGACGCGVPETDSDSDGTPDCNDGCPTDPNKITAGVCGCGTPDTDSDNDGTPDCNDGCPYDPNKTAPGACGCGVPETDSDTDGTPDCIDNCSNDPNKVEPGVCGCGVADADSDADGTLDCNDGCPTDPNKIAAGVCGCGTPDTDSDNDGTPDCNDGCPTDPNKIAAGVCGCGTPDTDSDNDGTPDCNDGCPYDPKKTAPGACGCGVPETDSDTDGTPDCIDNCSNDPNKVDPGVCGCGVADTDTDSDGTPNCNDGCPSDPNKVDPGICGCGVADTDSDSDGMPNCNDGCPTDPNKTAAGVCGCGTSDTDSDSDGTPDCNDGCPNNPDKTAPGACGCGVPETDSDVDGTPDCIDNCPNDPNKVEPGVCGCGIPDIDSDADGLIDCIEGCPDDPYKTDPGICGCGVPDTDSDGDGILDCNDKCFNDPDKVDPGVCGCGVADIDSDGDGILDCIDTDDDDDGMSDEWERDNGLNPLVDDAGEDPDRDGFSNFREYVGDTNPQDADDAPPIPMTLEDFETGDLSLFPWVTTGPDTWSVTTATNHTPDGMYAAEAPATGDNESASLEVSMYCEKGNISFWYAVSSEENRDYLYFYIDDMEYGAWSGEVPYTEAIFVTTSGMHTFRWIYAKDEADVSGADTAWVDDIIFPMGIDSDFDGMPDGWELENGLNLLFDDANEDPDGDGFNNFREYMANTNPQDADDFPPVTTIELSLPSGWSMISLPVIPENPSVANLFPEALVVYSYEKDAGYVRVKNNETLVVGRGYWILLDEEKTYTFTGQTIQSYTKTVSEHGWEMIGGCSFDAQPITHNCHVGVIYRCDPELGYQRVLGPESLIPGQGYWILLNDVIDQAKMRVEAMTQSGP